MIYSKECPCTQEVVVFKTLDFRYLKIGTAGCRAPARCPSGSPAITTGVSRYSLKSCHSLSCRSSGYCYNRRVPNISVTHMEILHGAYREGNANAVFFIRDDAVTQAVPAEVCVSVLPGVKKL